MFCCCTHPYDADAVPEMLLAAHMVIMATLDYLVVAQCASLLHQVFIPEEDVLHMPWVQGVLATKSECTRTGRWSIMAVM